MRGYGRKAEHSSRPQPTLSNRGAAHGQTASAIVPGAATWECAGESTNPCSTSVIVTSTEEGTKPFNTIVHAAPQAILVASTWGRPQPFSAIAHAAPQLRSGSGSIASTAQSIMPCGALIARFGMLIKLFCACHWDPKAAHQAFATGHTVQHTDGTAGALAQRFGQQLTSPVAAAKPERRTPHAVISQRSRGAPRDPACCPPPCDFARG